MRALLAVLIAVGTLLAASQPHVGALATLIGGNDVVGGHEAHSNVAMFAFACVVSLLLVTPLVAPHRRSLPLAAFYTLALSAALACVISDGYLSPLDTAFARLVSRVSLGAAIASAVAAVIAALGLRRDVPLLAPVLVALHIVLWAGTFMLHGVVLRWRSAVDADASRLIVLAATTVSSAVVALALDATLSTGAPAAATMTPLRNRNADRRWATVAVSGGGGGGGDNSNARRFARDPLVDRAYAQAGAVSALFAYGVAVFAALDESRVALLYLAPLLLLLPSGNEPQLPGWCASTRPVMAGVLALGALSLASVVDIVRNTVRLGATAGASEAVWFVLTHTFMSLLTAPTVAWLLHSGWQVLRARPLRAVFALAFALPLSVAPLLMSRVASLQLLAGISGSCGLSLAWWLYEVIFDRIFFF